MKRSRRRHRNPRHARARGLSDAFFNILTYAALGGVAYVAYRAYEYVSGNSGANLGARLA